MKNIILTFILSLVIIIIFYILNNYLIEKFQTDEDPSSKLTCNKGPPGDDCCYNHNAQFIFCPKNGCSLDGCLKKNEGKGCFSKDSKIKLEDGSFKDITDVKNGDRILSYSPQKDEFIYSPVVYIIHEKNNDLSTFIDILTEKNKKIRMTSNHLIPIIKENKIELISADKIVINDIIKTIDGDEKIISMEKVFDSGLYTLITLEEYIVVDNIVVSPFAISHIMGQFYYSMYRGLFKISPKILYSDGFRFYHNNAVKVFNTFIN